MNRKKIIWTRSSFIDRHRM